MRNITTKHGCFTPEICGALDHHTCGSPDACNTVRPNGVVCTFGTMTSVPVASEADVDAETDRFLNEHVPPQARVAQRDLHRAVIRSRLIPGPGNEDTPANEAAHRAAGEKHHADDRASHDADPSVYGHS